MKVATDPVVEGRDRRFGPASKHLSPYRLTTCVYITYHPPLVPLREIQSNFVARKTSFGTCQERITDVSLAGRLQKYHHHHHSHFSGRLFPLLVSSFTGLRVPLPMDRQEPSRIEPSSSSHKFSDNLIIRQDTTTGLYLSCDVNALTREHHHASSTKSLTNVLLSTQHP